MIKKLFLVAILTIISFAGENSEENDEQDSAVSYLSAMLIDLIAKYDVSGAGQITKEKYPYFLKDVFMKGSNMNENQYQHTQLLVEAGRKFTAAKQTEGDVVGIQQFYDDIIHKFTVFLMEKPEYAKIIETLYSDIETAKD